jgi:hypothetical protein
LAARFSLRRSLSVFCGFFFACFFGLSALLLKTPSLCRCPSPPQSYAAFTSRPTLLQIEERELEAGGLS